MKEIKFNENYVCEITYKDAINVYGDLTKYKVTVELKGTEWYVDYHLKEGLRGGGPHYVISGVTGKIIYKKYEQ